MKDLTKPICQYFDTPLRDVSKTDLENPLLRDNCLKYRGKSESSLHRSILGRDDIYNPNFGILLDKNLDKLYHLYYASNSYELAAYRVVGKGGPKSDAQLYGVAWIDNVVIPSYDLVMDRLVNIQYKIPVGRVVYGREYTCLDTPKDSRYDFEFTDVLGNYRIVTVTDTEYMRFKKKHLRKLSGNKVWEL